MLDSYYAPTAYNSAQPRKLPPPPRILTRVQRSELNYGLSDKGVQCREFLASDDIFVIELELNEENNKAFNQPTHEYVIWESLKNPTVLLRTVKAVAFVFAFFGFIVSLVGLMKSSEDFMFAFKFLFILPLIIALVCRYAILKGWVTDKHNIMLNRRTGMVMYTWEGKRVSYPFDEFDAAIQHVVGYEAQIDQYLVLVHRYTGQFCRNPYYRQERWQIEQDWEFWQQYMDISKPLPDIPSLEPFRARDPVTAEFDHKHNRPKDYWKNMSIKEANRGHDLSVAAAKAFPWGMTRDEAMRSWQWQPSGYGEAVYGENVVPMTQTDVAS